MSQSKESEKCPFQSCSMSGSLKRVLGHIRQVHDSNNLPVDFIARLNLQQCSYCKRWYLKLGQHASQCRKRKQSESASQRSSYREGSAPPLPPSCVLSQENSLQSSPQVHDSPSPCNKNVATSLCDSGDHVHVASFAVSEEALQSSISEVIQSFPVSLDDASRFQRQSFAWDYISNLPIDEILRALPSRTVMRISPSAKASFQECCAIALRKLQEDPMYVPAWKLLFLIPRMVLQPQGKSSSAEIKKIFHKFLDFRWDELIQMNAPQLTRRRPINANNESHLRAAALRLVRCGELARASRLLTSPGLAAATAETTKKLASKHPSRVSPLNVRPPNVQEPFILSKKIFFETIRRSPRGTGTGPSGWCYEHLKALLDNFSTADLLHSVCSSIASGSIPESTLNLLTASRLVAIPKPNGDVRPIAIGEALRRLTAKSICAQKKDSFAQFFSPLKHGVATKRRFWQRVDLPFL